MEYTDETLMPFGMHKGKPLGEVPDEYLLWLYGDMSDDDEGVRGLLFDYLADNIDAIKLNVR